METYVTDGILGAGELRVLAGIVVVTVRGDQDCEKEGYCREGLHGVTVGKVAKVPWRLGVSVTDPDHHTT